ncbi:ATP synthase subunit alpha, mitochondrial [Hordeum vulgare]|nr:ATP synthase subunit alpha, mitochondrial [Hordeum vulgare]
MVSIGDGIACVYGLNEIQVGDMMEFANGAKGITLNLENENVGIVVYGNDTTIEEGDIVKHTRSSVDVPSVEKIENLEHKVSRKDTSKRITLPPKQDCKISPTE